MLIFLIPLFQVRAMEQRLCDWPGPGAAEGAPRAITRLEGQIEEQVIITISIIKLKVRLEKLHFLSALLFVLTAPSIIELRTILVEYMQTMTS